MSYTQIPNPLCNSEQNERINNPQSTEDYLLKIRSDAVMDHTRIYRVLLKSMMKQSDKWDFEHYFNDTPFHKYLAKLSDDDLSQVEEIAKGFVFCNKPNGQIHQTNFGNIITISESLRYFLYFMNLAFLDFGESNIVPLNVRGAAIKIALRTMLQVEALDFELDPRGIIPDDIDSLAWYHTNLQLEFVIGHEYAHYFLEHLGNHNVIEETDLSITGREGRSRKYFSYTQQEELDADIHAIERIQSSLEDREDLLNRALFFFIYLDIYYNISEQIYPSSGIKTHPDPMDRFENLYQHYKNKVALNGENISDLKEMAIIIKESLANDVSFNIESYEEYGSIYLDEWRGKILVDRVDF